MSDKSHIHDDGGDLRKYRTEIPNIVDDMGLTPHAYRLYGHLKRVAGSEGSCWQTTRTLAQACNMSAGMVSKAKAELAAAGLITISKKRIKTNEVDDIHIVDIWAENFARYSQSEEGEPQKRVHNMNERVHNVNTGVHNMKQRSNKEEERTREEKTAADTRASTGRSSDGNDTAAAGTATLTVLGQINGEVRANPRLGQPLTALESIASRLEARGETEASIRAAWETCQANGRSPVGAFLSWCQQGFLPVASSSRHPRPEASHRPLERTVNGQLERWIGNSWVRTSRRNSP